MISNFQLGAIVDLNKVPTLQHVALDGASQSTLARTWHHQWLDLTQGCRYVQFDLGYHPESDERFVLANYAAPVWLLEQSEGRLADADKLVVSSESLATVRAMVAFGKLGDDEWILFQNFSRSHVMQPGRFLFLQRETMALLDSPALTLGGKLAAAYNVRTKQLIFENFRNTNSILSLTEFIAEASDQEIRTILTHVRIKSENINATLSVANQWMRKRFAMLIQSRVLDNHTAQELRERSEGYGVELMVDGDQIIFPQDPRHARKVLQFLNEERFLGAITKQLFETNSKRAADS